LQELSTSANDALKTTYEKMIKAGGTRLTVKPSEFRRWKVSTTSFPTSRKSWTTSRSISRCAFVQRLLELPPMLLLGEPGIGKTYFGSAGRRSCPQASACVR